MISIVRETDWISVMAVTLLYLMPGGWDIEHGDAQVLDSIKENTYDFVYSSHTLEHVSDADISLWRWFEVGSAGRIPPALYTTQKILMRKKTVYPPGLTMTIKDFF